LGCVDIWGSAEAFAEFGKTLVPSSKNWGECSTAFALPAHYVLLGQAEKVAGEKK